VVASRNIDASEAGAILERLTALYPKAIDMSLDRIRRLLEELGSPQDHLPPVLHVAGTNGKGSTVAYLRAALEAVGQRVHVYTSPHLVRFNERIRVAGKIIDDAELAVLLAEVERVNAGKPITFFEVTTAAAFLAFARNPADAVVLETGMGGRLDATNLVQHPVVCAITPISLDHVDYLGDTVAKIAGEKACILKPGSPAAIGPQPPEAAAVFDEFAARLGVKLHRFGREWTIEERADGFTYKGARRLDLPRPALPGRFQFYNAGIAIAALESMAGPSLPGEAVGQALRSVEWPGRLQLLKRGRLVEMLPAATQLFLDGGHNESAGEALADWAREGKERLDLVFAMRANKSVDGFFAHMAPYLRRVRAVKTPGDAISMDPALIVAAANKAGIADSSAAPSVESAVASLAQTDNTPRRILICGSLYLVGHVLATNG
jgi:dihydrofolate synthase/folylpolyglutamate synthase